jgi:hypothetical protein
MAPPTLLRPGSRGALLLAAALAICLGIPASAQEKAAAQDSPAPAASTARKASASKSPNVRSGEIAALDASGESLTVRDRTGKSSMYVLGEKTRYNRNRRPAQRSDFKVKDSVVLHFRRSRTDGAMLVSELDDPASWMWLAEIRKATTPAVVKLITDDTLSVTIGPESIPLDYTISEKTRWEKAGKEVEAAAFKPGDHVYVVPRSLPSGSVMARAVADSTGGAAQEKERLATSVHGTVAGIDTAAHKLTLRTLAGDTRNFAFDDETELVASGKQQPIGTLKAGAHVAVRVRHEAGGEELVWRITIETGRKSTSTRKRVSTPKGAATAH